jgi:hypothetical protein
VIKPEGGKIWSSGFSAARARAVLLVNLGIYPKYELKFSNPQLIRTQRSIDGT